MGWGVAVGTGISAIGSAIGGVSASRQATRTYRALRTRQFGALKAGKNIYNRFSAEAMQQLRDQLLYAQEQTDLAIAGSAQAEEMGVADINANLDRALAQFRSGTTGALAQSSFYPEGQRGLREDNARALLANRQQGSLQRGQMRFQGIAASGQARGALSQALLQSAAFKYGVQQDLAETWQQSGFRGGGRGGGAASAIDFGGLGAAFSMIPWGGGKGGGTYRAAGITQTTSAG